jgi:hypothetical protein
VLKREDIDPILALRELEGTRSRAVFRAALEEGEIETAYAALVYAIDLDPEERCGYLLLLAHDETQDARRSIRYACYRIAASVATVAPDLSDLTRAITLLEAGRGLKELGFSADALFYLDQAYAVARYSNRMTQTHRRTLLDGLIPLYRELGRRPETWQALADQVLTPTSSIGEGRPVFAELERPQLLYLSGAVIQATAARERMAQEVLRAAARGDGSITRSQLDDLASVLRHEDRVRRGSYEVASDQGHSVDLARDQAAWMALKSRVAHQGFGLSIVPEWEEQAAEIDAEWRAAQDTLYTQYARTEGDGAYHVLLLQLEHGLLGFYPDWPQAEWSDRLARLEPERTLRVVSRTQNQNTYFLLVGEPGF